MSANIIRAENAWLGVHEALPVCRIYSAIQEAEEAEAHAESAAAAQAQAAPDGNAAASSGGAAPQAAAEGAANPILTCTPENALLSATLRQIIKFEAEVSRRRPWRRD